MVTNTANLGKLKKCKLCGKELPSTDFPLNSQKCKTCVKLWEEWARGRKKTPEEIEKYGNARVHLLVPTYKKVYSLYRFDWDKYAAIWKRIQQVALKYDIEIFTKTNPYRVLDLCYVLDENGKRQPLGDERHIFRYKTLENVRKAIAKELLNRYNLSTDISVLKYLYKRTGIILDMQKGQEGAEIVRLSNEVNFTYLWDKPIRERLSLNIRLLRGLKKGLEIEEAVTAIIK